jgi:hypothetical protein
MKNQQREQVRSERHEEETKKLDAQADGTSEQLDATSEEEMTNEGGLSAEPEEELGEEALEAEDIHEGEHTAGDPIEHEGAVAASSEGDQGDESESK